MRFSITIHADTMKEPVNFTDINIRAQIAFGLALIAGLLVYIAFLK